MKINYKPQKHVILDLMKKYVPILLILLILFLAFSGISGPLNSVIAAPSPDIQAISPITPEPSPSPALIPPSTPKPTPEPPLGEQIAQSALSYVGYPYKYGEESPERGFDCSGLVFYVYGQHGFPLYRVASDMHKNGALVVNREDLKIGDILLFKKGYWIYHCGIYIGDNSFVHACDESTGVIVSTLDEYSNRGLEIRRVVGTIQPFTSEPFIAPE